MELTGWHFLFPYFRGLCGVWKRFLSLYPALSYTDVIILITSNSVHLYCNPINSNALLQVLGKINNLQLHCLNTEVMNSSEYL